MKRFFATGAFMLGASGLVYYAGKSPKPVPCAPEVIECGDVRVSAMECGNKTFAPASVLAIPDEQLHGCLMDAGVISLDGGKP